jgi:hypothetical protein
MTRVRALRTCVVLVLLAPALPGAASSQVSPAASAIQLEKDFADTLAQTLSLARELRGNLRTGTRPAEKTDRLFALFDEIRASDLLLTEEHDRLAAMLRADGAAGMAVQRQAQMRARYRDRIDAMVRAMDRVVAAIGQRDPNGDPGPVLDSLIRELEQAVTPPNRAPIGLTLPLRSLNLPQIEPQLGTVIVPAYADRTIPAPTAVDSVAGPDVPLSSIILTQAAALHQNPIEIVEFVRNQMATELYHGAMKGAEGTLRSRGGNDVDQASLLIGLMRASGIPARYVRGVVALSGAQAMSWTGVSSTRRVADLLTRAGIPFRTIRQGGTIGAFEVEHTWTEVYVPYGNYRGVPLDASGRTWIPLDPSFKALTLTPGADLPAGANFKAETLIPSYLSAPPTLSAVDFYKKTLTDWLTGSDSGLTLDRLTMTRAVDPAAAGLLPSTLPYATVSVNQELAALPDGLRHRVRFDAVGDGGTSLDVTIPASELLGRRLTLSYIPATVEDQIVANAFLGLNETPAYLVKVRPVLKVGGVVRAAGALSIQMGALHDVTIEIQTPRTTIPVTNTIMAGGYFAIGLAAGAADPPASDVVAAEDTEGTGGANELHRLAVEYLDRWNDADEFLAGVLHVVTVRPALSEVMVGGFYRRTFLFGEPQSIEWRGLFVDADVRISEPVPIDANDRQREFLRLSGLAGSELEARVLQENLEVDSISAAHLLQLARAAGIAVHDIDAANVATTLPLLQTAEAVKSDVADAVNQGWRVTIPERDFVRNIWSGIGYIVVDPASGAGGYFISGGLAGGATTEDPDDWAMQELADWFEHPYNSETDTNTNANAAASIQKVPITDKQDGKVGEDLPTPLAVLVRDVEGKAVKGANVTFGILGGDGAFDGNETVTVPTDYLGLAKATLTLGKRTGILPFYVKENSADTHLTQVGQNLITASVEAAGGKIALSTPFQLFAHPGPPHHIVKVIGDGHQAKVGTAAGTIRARIVDQDENPISNLPLEFSVLESVPVAQNAEPLPDSATPLRIYPQEPPCANPHPILGECNGVGRLTVITSSHGASVETILGDTIGTTFRVQASWENLPPEVFSLFSDGLRQFAGEYFAPELSMSLLHLVNEQGALMNATKVGTQFRRPLSVALLVTEDAEFTVTPVAGPTCTAEPNSPCYEVKSKGITRTRALRYPAETAVVTFTPIEGGGTTVPPVLSEPEEGSVLGRYSSRLTVGPEPGFNVVKVFADARIVVPAIDLHSGLYPDKPVSVKAGQVIVNVQVGSAAPFVSGFEVPAFHRVFGVRARLFQPGPPLSFHPAPVFVGSSGGATTDFRLDYLIEPRPLFEDGFGDVDLFKVNPEAPAAQQDEWVAFFPGRKATAEEDGLGLAPIPQGTPFDPTAKYRVQVVLDRGSEAEIRSEKEDLDAYLVAPLGVDFRAKAFTERESRRREDISLVGKLLGEKARMAGVINKGLTKAAADCALPVATMGLSMIEQGSGACFWSPDFQNDPVKACAAFQPGISDHDYEVFVPDALTRPQRSCLVGALNKVAAEDASNQAASGALTSGEVTFFAVPKSEFQNALLNVNPPSSDSGSDTLGDLGLGRQTLLLKWLLEGEYVTLPPLARPGEAGTLRLEAILEKLRTTPNIDGEKTGIPKLEAYEIALRERFNFYKARAQFRMAGTAALDSKGSLFEQQQNAVRSAAKAAIRAAISRLLVSDEGQKLLFITRERYRKDGCRTATDDPSQPGNPAQLGVKACDSFEEHIASAAVRSLGPDLNLFTSGEVQGQVYNFFRLKANPPCAADDCQTRIMSPTAANELLQIAILFIKQAENATRGLFDGQVNQDTPARAGQRLSNVGVAAERADEAKQSANLELEPRVFNDANFRFEFVPLDLYRDSSLEVPYELATIEPLSERIVDVYRDLQGNPIPDDQGNPQTIFRVPVAAGTIIPFTFALDRTSTIRECDTQDKSAGFFVYTLDESNPDPPDLDPAPPVPVQFPAPSQACASNVPASLKLTKLVNGQPDITVAPNTTVKVRHVVTNPGPRVVRNITLEDLLVKRSYGPFTLGPGASTTVDDEFTPTVGGLRLIGPTELIGFGLGNGGVVRAWDSVVLDVTRAMCDALIVPTDPDPNPYVEEGEAFPLGLAAGAGLSRVMAGGNVYRHYRVYDAAGLHAGFKTISLTVNGHSFQAETDSQGFVVHLVDGRPQRGLEVQAAWLGAPTDPPTPLKVEFVGIGGVPSVCAKPFWVAVEPRRFTRSMKAGTSIALEGAILTEGLGLKQGFGLDVSFDETTSTTDSFSIGRSIDAELGYKVNTELFSVGGQFVAEAKAEVGAEGGVSLLLGASDTHEFPYPPTADTYRALSYLFGSSLVSGFLAANPEFGGPLAAGVVNEIVEQVSGLDAYRTSIGASMGLSVEASANASAGLSVSNSGVQGLDELALQVGANAGISAAIVAGFDLAPPEKELTASIELRSAFDAKVAFDLGLGSLVDTLPATDAATETVANLLQLFEATTDLGLGIKLEAVVDTEALAITELKVAVTHKITYGVTLVGGSIVDGGPGHQFTRTFRTTDPSKVAEAVNKFLVIDSLIDSLTGPPADAEDGPIALADNIQQEIVSEIVGMLRLFDEYEDTVEKLKSATPKFGLKGFLAATGLEGELALNVDSSENHRIEKGTMRKSRMYLLERYPVDDDTNIPPGYGDKVVDFVNTAIDVVKTFIQPSFSILSILVSPNPVASISEILKLFSPSGVRLRIQNTAESSPFNAELIAFKYRPVAGPIAARPQTPSDVKGPADRPHYGIGGFFQFTPENRRLGAPAELQITYLDEEIASLDENTLAIYAWNPTRLDWDHVGGTVDPANNSVTAHVTTLRLYTVAPAMPAGRFSFTSQATSTGGQDPMTTVTYTSNATRMNTGGLVPDGTMFTVNALFPQTRYAVPFGTIESLDEDPLTDGIQIASHGGVVRFTAVYPGSAGRARIVAFSTVGTALSDAVIPFQ